MEFSSHSLNAHPRAGSIRAILNAVLAAANPTVAIQRELTRRADWIASYRRVFLLAVGKASMRMAEAALPFLTDRLAGGLIVTKHASHRTLGLLPVLPADHPLPGARSLEAGQRVLDLVSHLRADDLLLCLFSGGASALMTAPADGITLPDIQATTSTLLASGASIDELNALRRRMDKLKGGGLARLAAPARVLSLILSDVVGDKLEVIASGPTAPDPTTPAELESILVRYSLTQWGGMASHQESPVFDHVENILVGSNALALQAARQQAEREGFSVQILTDSLQGEARLVGSELARTLRTTHARTLCLLAGGETTVTVVGDGKGGRNQELALSAAIELDGASNSMLITFATDGDDGTTGAAGAVVTGDTLASAYSLGFDAHDHLCRNDSFTFFSALNDLLITGPTGTNVNDLVLMFRF